MEEWKHTTEKTRKVKMWEDVVGGGRGSVLSVWEKKKKVLGEWEGDLREPRNGKEHAVEKKSKGSSGPGKGTGAVIRCGSPRHFTFS